MTLLKLLLYIAIIAVLLTLLVGWLKKGHKSWLMTFLQNFTGVLFIVSGMVKAVDRGELQRRSGDQARE